MDKQTLSNYGWIVICVLVLATLLAFATPFSSFLAKGFEATSAGFEFTSYQMTSDVLGEIAPTPPEELQERHKFEYYSSLTRAINDVNANTIGKNADRDKENAVAGIYVDRGKVNVVLLKSNTEEGRVVISADMTINLGGNTLTSKDWPVLWVEKGNITIDGRLENSTVYSDIVPQSRILQVQQTANVQIKGGTYITEKSTIADGICASTVLVRGNLTVNNATIIISGDGTICPLSTKGDFANILVEHSIMKSNSVNGNAYIARNTSVITLKNCFAESSSQNNISYSVNHQKYDDATTGIIKTNIYNSEFNISSTNASAIDFIIHDSVTDGSHINIENSFISTTSNTSSAYCIKNLDSSQTQINITKSDLIGTANTTTNISYGIYGNDNTHVNIDRSTILVNKHLEGTDIKNSIGISKDVKLNNKYSTIFGTKENISTP